MEGKRRGEEGATGGCSISLSTIQLGWWRELVFQEERFHTHSNNTKYYISGPGDNKSVSGCADAPFARTETTTTATHTNNINSSDFLLLLLPSAHSPPSFFLPFFFPSLANQSIAVSVKLQSCSRPAAAVSRRVVGNGTRLCSVCVASSCVLCVVEKYPFGSPLLFLFSLSIPRRSLFPSPGEMSALLGVSLLL